MAKRDNPKYPPWHCMTLTLCEKCGEYFEASLDHICRKKNSYPVKNCGTFQNWKTHLCEKNNGAWTDAFDTCKKWSGK